MADDVSRALVGAALQSRIAFAKRVNDSFQRAPAARPFSEMGVAGTSIRGGYVFTREKSTDWRGRKKYETIADMAVNCSIVAAGVHYFLNLIAHPQWTFKPAEVDGEVSDEAKEAADLVEEVLHDMDRPWSRVVRRAGTFRFYGFGVQEWTAKRRLDGKIGLRSVEPRPQHTIDRWSVSRNGTIEGVWQRDPETGQELGIPRSKIMYLVDDTLTDSPEGIGVFRHLAEPWSRLKNYYLIEERAFERDLRGIPVGRVPYTVLNQMVDDGDLTQEQAEALAKPVEDFVQLAIKASDTGITLDSVVYESQAADGRKVSGEKMFGLDLLQGTSNGITELGSAIKRTLHEMSVLLTTSHLMLGMEGSSGNRALAEDHSRNLYLIGNAVLEDIAAATDADLVARICTLNGIPGELWPEASVEDVSFKSAESISNTLEGMARAGALLSPDDPVIKDVRELMGVSPPTEVPIDLRGLGEETGDLDTGPGADVDDGSPAAEGDLGEDGAGDV